MGNTCATCCGNKDQNEVATNQNLTEDLRKQQKKNQMTNQGNIKAAQSNVQYEERMNTFNQDNLEINDENYNN